MLVATNCGSRVLFLYMVWSLSEYSSSQEKPAVGHFILDTNCSHLALLLWVSMLLMQDERHWPQVEDDKPSTSSRSGRIFRERESLWCL